MHDRPFPSQDFGQAGAMPAHDPANDKMLARAFIVWLAAFALTVLISLIAINSAKSAPLSQNPAITQHTVAASSQTVTDTPHRSAGSDGVFFEDEAGRTALGFRSVRSRDAALGGMLALIFVAGFGINRLRR